MKVKKVNSDLKIKQAGSSQKVCMSLKTRGSEKVPHSKSSYSRLIFCM